MRRRSTVGAHTLGRAAVACAVTIPLGCTSLVSQIPPSNLAELEQLESRASREEAFTQNQIVVHKRINGLRYTKGDDLNTPESDWQSLDLILRSDRSSAAALPDKKRRASNVMIGMAAVGGLATTTGIAATAGQGLDTTRMTASGALLLGGAVVAVACSVAAGVLYGKMRKDYQRAVEVYNASLSMRLGLARGDGRYIPPGEVLVDPDGFVVLTPSGSFVRESNLDAYNAEVRAQEEEAAKKLTPDATQVEAPSAGGDVPSGDGDTPPSEASAAGGEAPDASSETSDKPTPPPVAPVAEDAAPDGGG